MPEYGRGELAHFFFGSGLDWFRLVLVSVLFGMVSGCGLAWYWFRLAIFFFSQQRSESKWKMEMKKNTVQAAASKAQLILAQEQPQ